VIVYTHTEEKNKHVIELNMKLGYRIVRRGQIYTASLSLLGLPEAFSKADNPALPNLVAAGC